VTGGSTRHPCGGACCALACAWLQLLVLQRDAPKQLAVPVAKEGKRVEAAVGQKVDKLMRAHAEAQYARLQEDMQKREKAENQRTQQVGLPGPTILHAVTQGLKGVLDSPNQE